MADVRALLAKERQSRRITHPYAAYSKSGVLSCTACTLNIKSETLWEGHLRSANHRKNAQRVSEAPHPSQTPKSLKRKIEDVDESVPEVQDYEVDNRKKSRSVGEVTQQQQQRKSIDVNDEDESNNSRKNITDRKSSPSRHVKFAIPEETEDIDAVVQDIPEQAPSSQSLRSDTKPVPVEQAAVDEDEWAAFERDVAPLTQVDYNAATISAAPVSAEQLAAEAEAERRKLKDTEAEDEKEDEGRRIEEEFDVMEEMEQRVRKLREKREMLRSMHGDLSNTVHGQRPDQMLDAGLDDEEAIEDQNEGEQEAAHDDNNDDDDDDDEDEDDWYS